MKYFNKKIQGFIEWMKNSAENQGDDPLYKIPTLSLFQQYRLESDEPIEELTDEERNYLDIYSENLIFALSSRGILKSDMGKLYLEAQRGWSARTKPVDDGVVDLVTWDFNDLETENTAPHDNINIENTAVSEEMKKNVEKKV